MADSTKPSTRDLILNAAEALVERDGPGRLTIDGVAAEGGISKGGVLYHFPNKLALLQAMVERMISSVADEIAAAETLAGANGTPVLPAVVDALLHRVSEPSSVSNALLAASAEQPDLLDPVCQRMTEIFQRLADTAPDPVKAQIILLALDGLKLTALLGLTHVHDDQMPHIRDRLIAMANEMYA